MPTVPDSRIRAANDRSPRQEGDYVLYWMVANRRPRWNFSLDRAIFWAHKMQRPLLVFEALRCGYRWSSDRIHRFVLQGMAAHAAHFAAHDVAYYPYIEPDDGADKGLLQALAARACVVVSDDFPSFFLPRMHAAAAARLDVRLELVDANGLYPMRAAERTFPTAYAFRRHLQKVLPPYLHEHPSAQPLRAKGLGGAQVPAAVRKRWPPASAALLAAEPAALAALPIDHDVGPASLDGGFEAGEARGRDFLGRKLGRYGEDRNHPDADGSSGISPYLHFGNLSVHQLWHGLIQQEHWDVTDLAAKASGSREGWWGMSAAAEAFLDEVITWREIGYNRCALDPDGYDRYETLPEWARTTLAEHEGDERPKLYTRAQLEAAETDDPVWNAAQRQIRREGTLHNYMRMLWGKNVLGWSKSPQQAAATLVELNNKYGLDGRNPNSYSGIFWVFGRYDRPWPERPVFGKVRYMTSQSTARKLRLKTYLATFAA